MRLLRHVAWNVALALIVGLAHPHTLSAQNPRICKWGDRIRVTVLFDNSGTVVLQPRPPRDELREWLYEVSKSLRPGDRVQIFGLLESRLGGLPQFASMEIPSDPMRLSELADSAKTFAARLFDARNANDTTDLTASLHQLHETLSAGPALYCSDAVVLLTDGSISPFRTSAGVIPAPSTALADFVTTARELSGGANGRIHSYAVSLGADRAPAIDSLYRREWERTHGPISPTLFEMQGDKLLERGFGRIYDISSVARLTYKGDSSIFATAFAMRHNESLPFDELPERSLRYLILVEPETDSTSLCDPFSRQTENGVEWSMVGTACLLHMGKLSRSLFLRLGRQSPWYSFSQDVDEVVSGDTISDPHQIVLRDVQSSAVGACDARDLFFDVREYGLPPGLAASPFTISYQLSRGTNNQWSPRLPLRYLRSSGWCLVMADITEADPEGSFTDIRYKVERADPSGIHVVVFATTQHPWVPSNIVQWDLTDTRSLVSALTFIDRWLVSGSVIIRTLPDALDSVDVGAMTFPLREDAKCRYPQASILMPPGLHCLRLSGLYVGPGAPSLALIRLAPACEREPRNCHFARLTASSLPFRLPLAWVVLWFIVGNLARILAEVIKQRSIDPSVMFPPKERPRIILGALRTGIVFVWFAEAVVWTPEAASANVVAAETIVPGLFGVGIYLFPKYVLPLLKRIGWPP